GLPAQVVAEVELVVVAQLSAARSVSSPYDAFHSSPYAAFRPAPVVLGIDGA
ncbi:hypothetical protein A2U01_0079048, partial [Trifolium medium]|nr:hypothetical protein [Trifolium medium]